MAVIQVRQRQISDQPQKLQGLSTNIGSKTEQAERELIRNATNTLDQMAKERDNSVSREAYQTFSDMDRGKLQQLKDMRGKDAIHAVGEYNKWYDKENAKISKNLENKAQQDFFKLKSEARRGSSLNTLNAHQVVETRNYNQSVYDGDVVNLSRDVAGSPEDVDSKIAEAFTLTDTQYPGTDNTARKAKLSASMATTSIQMLTDDSPGKAREILERHKESLGTSYNQLKRSIDAVDFKNEAVELVDDARAKFTDDIAKQREYVRKQKKGNAKLVDETVRRLNIRDSEDKKSADTAQKEVYIATVADVNEWISEGATQLDIEEEFLPVFAEDKENLEKMRKYIVTRYKQEEAVDWDAYILAQNEIDASLERGEPLTNEEVQLNWGADVGKKLPALLSRNTSARKTYQKSTNKRAVNTLKKFLKDSEFGDPKKSKAKEIYASIDSELNQFMVDDPQGNAADWLRNRMEVYWKEKVVKDLDGWSPFSKTELEQFSDEGDRGLAITLLEERGVDSPPESLINSVISSREFQAEKLKRLSDIEANINADN